MGFWENYDGYLNSLDPFYRGLWIGKGRRIDCEVGAIIDGRYQGDNDHVKEFFSIIANDSDIVIENMTIWFSNVRYAIHDDFSTPNSNVVFRNIHFNNYSRGRTTIGVGFSSGCRYYLANLVFESREDDEGWDINYHTAGGSQIDNGCEIYIRNCFGNRGCGFWSNGPTEIISNCYVSNSRFQHIDCYVIEGYTKTKNIRLIEWCNEGDINN